MRSTFATEVPPNFMTRRGIGISREVRAADAGGEPGAVARGARIAYGRAMSTRQRFVGGRSVVRGEVERFDRLARDWWDPSGPMRALHRINPLRLAFIRDEACAH